MAVPAPAFQREAPIVGEWDVVLTLEGLSQALVFRSHGQGVYGRGAGALTITAGPGGETQDYPAVWENRDPGRVRIASEVTLRGPDGVVAGGTLLLRAGFASGGGMIGEAVLIDEELAVHRGAVRMTRKAGRVGAPGQVER
jgi:hypothetical protein